MAKSSTPNLSSTIDPGVRELHSSAINTACLELQHISDALREFIETHEEGEKIVELSRGMLMRVSTLADAICMTHDATINASGGEQLFDAARRLIYGEGSRSEVTHG